MIPSHVHFLMLKSGCRSKAVSDGVVIWHATSSVIARACRFPYGNVIMTPYDSENAIHRERPTFKDLAGQNMVTKVWCPIVKRVSWGVAIK